MFAFLVPAAIGIAGIAWTPDGASMFALRTDGTVNIWQGLGNPRSSFRASNGGTAIAVHSTGNLITVGEPGGDVLVFTRVGDRFTRVNHFETTGRVQATAISPDGKLFAAGCITGFIHLFDTKEVSRFVELGNGISWLQFSRNGNSLLSGGQTWRIWDLTARDRDESIRPRWEQGHWTLQTAYSPDETLVVGIGPMSSKDQGRLRSLTLRRAADGMLLLSVGHTENLSAIAYSPDGASVAVGTESGEVRLYRPQDLMLVRKWKTSSNSIKHIAYGKDPGRLMISDGQKASIWLTSGKRERTLEFTVPTEDPSD
jgi:WD40 repeat protein